ncbi:hypothetical protein RA2_02289 [Roseovarius sp. A-2]|uniref:N-(5'-phosphoribosyl)anthranilate isomerase n=1 Tax=Roseovarius sp. A-2 TaxID=1570360 RepID=UPI0009B52F0D|nr:N-(5'-phosphoribosyl)anthranilate isomerase [Roseovarius sp. A-2]GAW35229.1 hypothetical protein RA2_02289 [Roseovarius sp. A-2]
MQMMTRKTPPEDWLNQMFAAKAARKDTGVRSSIPWVDREVGRDRFQREVRQRGFHLIETADQYIVVCHNGPVRILV